MNIIAGKLKSKTKPFTKKVKDMAKILTPNLIIKKSKEICITKV